MNRNKLMSVPFKTSPLEFDQHLLFPSNLFKLLPDAHDCYVYKGLFEQLDTSALESNDSRKGQNAYHPKCIVAILIYAYSRGGIQFPSNRKTLQWRSFFYDYRPDELP